MENPLLRFVLARTERGTKRPYFDDLSHHSLVIALSQLHINNPTAVMAGLLHDYFKGLFFFKNESRYKWYHVADKKDYRKIIPENIKNINEKKLIELVYKHHRKNTEEINPIKVAESGNDGIVRNIECGIFFSDSRIYGLKSFKILPKGRYHWLLASFIHETIKKYLSKLYSKKLDELLNFTSLEFRYIPVSFKRMFDTISENIKDLKLEEYTPFIKDKCLVIPIPVKDFSEEFSIIYSDTEKITMDYNSITIPFGEALSLFSFSGNEILLSYVDPGVDVDLSIILKKILKEYKKEIEFPYSEKDLESSLKGEYHDFDHCSFCGSPASKIISTIVKNQKFTDVFLLFDDRGVACPTCYLGYLLEREKVNLYIRPQEAELYEVNVPPNFKKYISEDFASSTSGLMWQQVLSAIWYRLFINNKFPEFVLDPCIKLHPITLRFAPKAFFPMAWRSGNKKYCLESSVNSGLTALGSVENITGEEFKEISKAYKINKDRINEIKMIKKIKIIYGIRM